MKPNHRSRDGIPRGMSLLELLVVLTIMGFVAGSVAPAIRSEVSEGELESATRRLQQLVAQSRRTAIARALPVSLCLDSESGRYWIITRSAQRDSVVATGLITLPPGVRVESRRRRAEIRFAPTGQVSSTDVITVHAASAALPISSITWRGAVP